MTIKYSLFGLALTGLIIIGTAGSALAKAHHLAPQPFDAARPSAASAPGEVAGCFMEPEGFKSQIRWDGACRDARAKVRGEHGHSGQPDRFEAPRGFKNQIRWD